jgi:hypothetical protein
MALIVDFPDFAATTKPDPADLNTAISKIVEQLGGVDGDGAIRPGGLDLTNHVAAVGFRNTQKREPRNILALTVDLNDNGGAPYTNGMTARRRAGPVPYRGEIVGIAISAGLVEGMGFDTAALTLRVGRREFKFGPDAISWDSSGFQFNADFRWAASVPIFAGESIYVEAALVPAVALPHSLLATVWIAVDHRS